MLQIIMEVRLGNRNRDKIVVSRETGMGRTILGVHLYGGSEEYRFGSPRLRHDFERKFPDVYPGDSIRTLIDDVEEFIRKKKLKVAGLRVYGYKGTPFPYVFREPGRRYFSKRYLSHTLDVSKTIFTSNVRGVGVFARKGRVLILKVEGNKAHFFAHPTKEVLSVELPSPKLARSLKDYVSRLDDDEIDYTIGLGGLLRNVPTQKKAFLDSLYSIAYNKKLWKKS